MIPRKILPDCALKNREKWIFRLKNSQKIDFSKISMLSWGFNAKSPRQSIFQVQKRGYMWFFWASDPNVRKIGFLAYKSAGRGPYFSQSIFSSKIQILTRFLDCIRSEKVRITILSSFWDDYPHHKLTLKNRRPSLIITLC